MTDDEARKDRVGLTVNAFLQNKSMEKKRDYLARGRRFAKLDVEQLNQEWMITIKSWLAHKKKQTK